MPAISPSRLALRSLLLAAMFSTGCDKQAPPPAPPPTAAAPAPKPEPEPEPEPEPPKVPDDALAVGMFNLEWAFDTFDADRPKKARPHMPTDEADWAWKRDRIVDILVAEKLDVVGLLELGGEREMLDVVTTVRDKGGYDYNYVLSARPEKTTGQFVALLSRFPLSDGRVMLDGLAQHVVADFELPDGESVTAVVFALREGQSPAHQSKRRKVVRGLKKKLNAARKTHPVIALGTTNSRVNTFDDDYSKRTPGLLAGVNTARNPADDCSDSASEASGTTIDGTPVDRIFACGLEMRNANISAEDAIVRELQDPTDAPWHTVPIAEEPHRDVSDHFLVWAEIARPKPPAPPAEAEPDPTS